MPAGAVVEPADARGTQVRTEYPADMVLTFVRAQLRDAEPTHPAPGVSRFTRVTPRNADPRQLSLYVLIVPSPTGGTELRIMRLPNDVSEEAARARADQFAHDLPRFD